MVSPPLLRSLLVALALVSFGALWIPAYSNGLAKVRVGYTEPDCPAPGLSVPYHVVTHTLCVLVSFFHAGFSHPYGRQLVLFIVSLLIAPLGIAAVQTSSLGVFILGGLGQLMTAGIATPMWLAAHVNPPATPNPRHIATLLPSFLLGYLVPSVAMLFPRLVPFLAPKTITATWQFFPLGMYLVSTFLYFYPILPSGLLPQTRASLLRSLSIISLATYYSSLYFLSLAQPSLSRLGSILGIFAIPFNATTYPESAYLFLFLDAIFIFLAPLVFVFLAPVTPATISKTGTNRANWKMLLGFLALVVLGGPGFALLETWRWRIEGGSRVSPREAGSLDTKKE